MRKILFLISCIGILSCQPTTTPTIRVPTATKAVQSLTSKSPLKVKPNCPVQGKLLKENSLWLSEQSVLVRIIADSSTYDKKFGDSHRIIALYNSNTCASTLQLSLPINKSPDFPYYLADINYNHASNIVAIKGANTVYCLDVVTKKMLPTLIPQFKTARKTVDAQSGLILRLEHWEHFIIGYAQDLGVFVFDINTPTPIPMLPYAEFKNGAQYNSLFLLASSDNTTQAILPYYDWEQERFVINPLFKTPTHLQKEVVKSALNNRYLILKEKDSTIGVDLKKRLKITLPAAIQTKEVKNIIKWMESQQ